MAWDNAPTAIDGTQLQGEDLRRGLYVTNPSQGIAGVGDLKVLPLSTPGNGFRVSPGGALVFNRYVTPIRESYAIGMPTETIFPSASMPASVGSIRSHLVAATVADDQYSNAGHPWFPSDFPVGVDPLTYDYVRTHLFQNVPAGSGQAWLDANFPYPALALARLDMPASTTTVQASHIIDLRKMANPRSSMDQWNVPTSTPDVLNTAASYTYEVFPDNSAKAVDVPIWATKVYINAWIYNFIQGGGVSLVNANFRVAVAGGVAAQFSNFYSPVAEAGRKQVLMGAPLSIPESYRGTTKTFQIEGTYADQVAMASSIATDVHTSCMVQLRFVEEAV